MITHALLESSSGYGLFQVKLTEDIAAHTQAAQDSIKDLSKFGKMVSLMSFAPFKNAAHALENANDVSEGIVNDYLKDLLELNLAKASKKSPAVLAVSDSTLGGGIKEAAGIQCDASDNAQNIIRGLRLHAGKLLKGLQDDDLTKAQLGLGHSYSRAKLKFNVNRVDNMIIQAIALLDQLDKDVNLFSMRVREWYGYHFPELVKLVPDNHQYAKAVQFIGDKDTLDEDKLPELEAILEDNATTARNILDAARGSMGSSLSEMDMMNIHQFAIRVISLAEYRKSLISYLTEKMNVVGTQSNSSAWREDRCTTHQSCRQFDEFEQVPCEYSANSWCGEGPFQGFEDEGKYPEVWSLIPLLFYRSCKPETQRSYISVPREQVLNSIANRLLLRHTVSEVRRSSAHKVEERLNFFETGAPPSKNADAMRQVLEQLGLDDDDEDEDMEDAEPALTMLERRERKKKRKSDAMDVDEEEEAKSRQTKKVKLSKEEKKALKKEKKAKAKAEAAAAEAEDVPMEDGEKRKEGKEKEKKSKSKE
ncbi:Nucleolar protein 56 [Marasmius tenuissimus]|uniref:Nucleolar protein 56 n=1 Tax=Marasmius tenuissimus TaxID=585030 RepID=A0ABR2ZKB6_9AGAR